MCDCWGHSITVNCMLGTCGLSIVNKNVSQVRFEDYVYATCRSRVNKTRKAEHMGQNLKRGLHV